MSFPSLLDSTADIFAEALSSDSQGGYSGSGTYTTVVYRRVPCRFENIAAKLLEKSLLYAKQAIYPDYFVYMEYRSGIKEGHAIKKDGRTWLIKLIHNWSEQNKIITCEVVEKGRTEL